MICKLDKVIPVEERCGICCLDCEKKEACRSACFDDGCGAGIAGCKFLIKENDDEEKEKD